VDVDSQKRFEALFIENTRLQEKKVKTVVDLLKIQEQLLEREQVVFSKDETIKMARDEQINLENFRFMLDQKIKSLTMNKGTLVAEIDSREKILRDMFNELIEQSQENNKLYQEIKGSLSKQEILSEQKKNIELKIYYWSMRIKEYHRKISSSVGVSNKVSNVKILINKLISESNVEQAKGGQNEVDSEIISKLTNVSSDVGTKVHEELLAQNKWLIQKLYMIDTASKHIRKIREENIETGLNQNKRLIEECNQLKVGNDYLLKRYNYFQGEVKKAEHHNNQIIEEKNKLKKGAKGDNGATLPLLSRVLQKQPAEQVEAPSPNKNQGDSDLAKSFVRKSQTTKVIKKRY
jgi:hypothetical protein